MTGAYEFTEAVRGRTEIWFSSLFRRGTEYAVEHVMGYGMYPSLYAPLYAHLRYDVFRDGEFIGQEGDFLAALRLVAADFAFGLWKGPIGRICPDEDRLEELVWWFVRWIPEDKGGCEAETLSNAYRPTKKPEEKPTPPKSGSLYRVGITEDEADELIRRLSVLSGMMANLNEVSIASVVTQNRIT